MSNTPTDPPPSPAARALGAIDRNLDALGEIATEQAACLATLTELGEQDAATLRGIDRKLDQIIAVLQTDSARLGELERWRGEHEADHARQ